MKSSLSSLPKRDQKNEDRNIDGVLAEKFSLNGDLDRFVNLRSECPPTSLRAVGRFPSNAAANVQELREPFDALPAHLRARR